MISFQVSTDIGSQHRKAFDNILAVGGNISPAALCKLVMMVSVLPTRLLS